MECRHSELARYGYLMHIHQRYLSDGIVSIACSLEWGRDSVVLYV